MTSHLIEAAGLSIGYHGVELIKELNFGLQPGEFWVVIGPNGAGKTTLLRTVVGELRPIAGTVLLRGKAIYFHERRKIARIIGYVPQRMNINPFMRVEDYLMLGRYHRIGAFRRPSASDREVVKRAMSLTDTLHLRGRYMGEISMGELQRIRIARALAQEPELLVLDEPLVHLDPGHRFQLMEMLKKLSDGGMAIFAAVHDVETASLYATHVLLLGNGRYVRGEASEVLDSKHIEPLFDVRIGRYRGKIVLLPPG